MIDDIIDIHAHVIPGTCEEMDDGADSYEEAIAMLKKAKEEGASVVFATPHYGHENIYCPDKGMVFKRFLYLKAVAHELIPGLKLRLGMEWYCADDLDKRLREGFLMNYSKYAMVEFLEWKDLFEPRQEIIRKLGLAIDKGISPILAHAERYRALQEAPEAYRRLKKMGVLFQANAYDLSQTDNELTRETAQYLAYERMIDFIGSDMHGMGRREPQLQIGARWLMDNTDEKYAHAVLHGNAARLLKRQKDLEVDDLENQIHDEMRYR